MKTFVRILVLGMVAVLLSPTPSHAFTGGLLQSDITLTKANSPYNITKPIQIPEGITLTVEAGVDIFSRSVSELFYVHGTVRLLGTFEEPVRISSRSVVFLPDRARSARIEVRHASIDGGQLVGSKGNAGSAHFSFTDSDFTNWGGAYIYYPLSFIAERNVFQNASGFSIGFDGRTGTPAPVFRNNLFVGPPMIYWDKQYWLEVWASYGSSLQFQKNTFLGGPYTAILTNVTVDELPLNATQNYWGSVDAEQIASMVLDRTDGLAFGTLVDTSSFLTSSDSATPVSLRYKALVAPAPTPTPTTVPSVVATPSASARPTQMTLLRYKNCTELNKVYSGGVAKTARSKNKGKKPRLKQVVNSRLYELNKSLDRDKDGLACER